MDAMKRIHKAAEAVEKALGRADIAVVLGSGLGDYGTSLQNAKSMPYGDIPGFPEATVPGHAGELRAGDLGGKRVIMMRGRFHSYEGYSMDEVTLPMRVFSLLGVKTVILTNAAGGVNTAFAPGDLMLIEDFINFSGKNPLRGENLDAFGPRFPEMSTAYDKDLRALTVETASVLGITLRRGVYMWNNGPCYETPAEIRMARILGADAVGMSTVPETIVARHCGMRVLGVSCITNMAAGVLEQPINHEEVMETGARVKETFKKLLDGVIAAL